MEEEKITLTEESVRSLICATYQQDDVDPNTFLYGLLHPYYISREQLLLATGDHIEGGEKISENHPVYYIVETLKKNANSVIPDLGKSTYGMYMKRFIFACTALPHMWYKPGIGPQFMCAYETADAPVPYVWFHIESKHRMLMLQRHHRSPPPVRICYQRYIYEGQPMFPLWLDFFEGSKKGLVTFSLGIEANLKRARVANIIGQADEDNLVIFLTQGHKTEFLGCFLISPSVEYVWRYPVIIHLLPL